MGLILRNTTATIAESLRTVEGQLVRVEVLVLLSNLLLVLLVVLSPYRHRRGDKSFRFLVWAIYTLSTVLVPYTIGLLEAGPFHDQTFVLWSAVLLVQSGADSLSAYNLRDVEQWKRKLLQQGLQILLVLWLMVSCKGHNKSYSATIWVFWILSIAKSYARFQALREASKTEGLMKHTKVVADYMMTEHESAQVFDATTMEGYRYIFHGEELTLPYFSKPDYRTAIAACAFTTVDTVWQWIDSQSVSVFSREHGGILKDIALSFTLFKLLKRRFCKYEHGEAGRPKTLRLVVSGLLREEASYIRAFRVIEMELAFLYDFFYTRHQSHTQYVGVTAVFVLPVIVANAVSGAFSRHYHRTSLEQTVNGIDVVHCITIVLMVIVVAVFIVESRINDQKWRVVDDLHTLTGASRITINGVVIPFDDGSRKQALNWVKKRKHKKLTSRNWDRKLGQYSLLHKFDYHPRNIAWILSLGLIEPTREGQKASEKIKLPEEVVMRVLSRFKENDGHLADGQSALAGNDARGLSWACDLPTHIHTILVWHIGTTICEITTPPQEPLTGDRLVAKSLSNYCAYLLAFVPDMLPGHSYDTRRIFDAVVMEAREYLAGCDSMRGRCVKLLELHCSELTILGMGAKLGSELRRRVYNRARRWKLLADFWAEFVLFLAPSSNADVHAETLAAGGEFMTHLWALLIHAGILEHPCSSSATNNAGGYNNATTQDSVV
ncbi:uncharacterized protein LOC133885324 [Phragmites australis]|uniref:uncharacterized protein LOC133885324 n=1 Tax=Phragmites australis TaxID=29695 RepID=UPI002D777B26|nr:uncharacterized protein LOC133885324 [Phragmites australis]